MGTSIAIEVNLSSRDYTCMGDEVPFERIHITAKSPEEADCKVEKVSWLIIESATPWRSVGARKVMRRNGDRLAVFEIRTGKMLESGDVCSIEVGDPWRVKDVVYKDMVKINGSTFLHFIKSGINIWAWEDKTFFYREDSA